VINHNKSTRQNINLFHPSISLTKVQKVAYYSGIKIYNYLSKKLKHLSSDQNSFVPAFNRFLYVNSFIHLKNILITNISILKYINIWEYYYHMIYAYCMLLNVFNVCSLLFMLYITYLANKYFVAQLIYVNVTVMTPKECNS
jgi:hypothetical protein